MIYYVWLTLNETVHVMGGLGFTNFLDKHVVAESADEWFSPEKFAFR
jgi:hypothetical protein